MSGYKILTLHGTDVALKPYVAMIYSDFLRTLRFGNDWFELIDSDSYYRAYEKAITNLLTTSWVRLAVLGDSPDTCLGWSMADGTVLHFVYVKRDFRKQGIGESLLPDEITQMTHLTKIGQAIRKAKFPNVIFNPFGG